MNPGALRIFQVASRITFTFGALTFIVLAFLYWRERRRSGGVFQMFTLVCAAAFTANLCLAAAEPDSHLATGLLLALRLLTGLLPPLIVHLASGERRAAWPLAKPNKPWLPAFYALSITLALGGGLEDAELISTGWSDALDKVPAAMFALAGGMGLLLQMRRHSPASPLRLRQRKWLRWLLLLTMASGCINLVTRNPLIEALPDYLVLGFFCVTLYYQERLTFWDLIIKRGAFFALGLFALTVCLTVLRQTEPLTGALLLMPLWLAAPWIFRVLESAIDRAWLGRRYTAAEAERKFSTDIQLAASEADLRDRAAASLKVIFQVAATVGFEPGPPPKSEEGIASALDPGPGWIHLAARPDSVPYLSGERRLVQSLGRTLAVVLDNVRFREREDRLRLFASRAELRALRAQINPHFLFNALNAISSLIPDSPELANDTIEQLADVFRYTLRSSEQEWVALQDEVDFVAACLRIEQVRFGARLRVAFDIDPAARRITIPAMTIQPLAENAIKHGVSVLEGPGEVRLRAAVGPDALLVEVFDNGPGFPPGFALDQSAGHGLRNIRDRLKGYYGEAAVLRWNAGPGETLVEVRIPLGEEHAPRTDRR